MVVAHRRLPGGACLARAEQLHPLLGTQGKTRGLCLLRRSWPGLALCPQRPVGLGCCQAGLVALPAGWGTGTGCCGVPIPDVPAGGEGMLLERGAGCSHRPRLCCVLAWLRGCPGEDEGSPLLLVAGGNTPGQGCFKVGAAQLQEGAQQGSRPFPPEGCSGEMAAVPQGMPACPPGHPRTGRVALLVALCRGGLEAAPERLRVCHVNLEATEKK